MEIWGLARKVRLGTEWIPVGKKCKHINLSLLGAELAEHNKVWEMIF